MNYLALGGTALLLAGVMFVGTKYKMNLGLLAIPFFVFIKVFLQGASSAEVIALWPTSICVQICAVMIFYGFMMENGVLSYIASYALFLIRKVPAFLPLLASAMALFLAACGVFPNMITALLLPIFVEAARQLEIDETPFVLWLVIGSWCGGLMPSGMVGTVLHSYMLSLMPGITEVEIQAVFSQARGLNYAVSALAFALTFLCFRGWSISQGIQNADTAFCKPAPLAPRQKKALYVFIGTVCVLFLPNVLVAVTGSGTLRTIAGKLDLVLVFFSAALVCMVLKLGDTATIIRERVPWNICIMLFGVAGLFQCLQGFGLSDVLSDLFRRSVPPLVLALVCLVVAGLIAMISDGLSVVVPLMFPIIWSLSAATGTPLALLFYVVTTPVVILSFAPLCSTGALTIGVFPPEKQEHCQPRLWKLAFLNLAVYAITISVLYPIFFCP